MTKEHIEVLRLALEAWEKGDGIKLGEILKEALAQPAVAEQHKQSTPCGEPVAWMFQHEETGRTMCVDAKQLEWGFEKGNPRLKKIAPLYTTPPYVATPRQRIWVGLTDEEKQEWIDAMPYDPQPKHCMILVNIMEAKLKEKNP